MSTSLRFRNGWLAVCAAFIILMMPRTAFAQYVEVEAPVMSFFTTNTDVIGCGLEYPVRDVAYEGSYGSTSGYSGGILRNYVSSIDDNVNLVINPSNTFKASIGWVFNSPLPSGSDVLLFIPNNVVIMERVRSSYPSHGTIDEGEFSVRLLYCPAGSDPVFSSNYVDLPSAVDGVITLPANVKAISILYTSHSSLGSYMSTSFSSNSACRAGWLTLPQLFVQFPGGSTDGTLESIDYNTSQTNTIVAQGLRSVQNGISMQTNQLMDTTGADDLMAGAPSMDSFISENIPIFGELMGNQDTMFDGFANSGSNHNVLFPGLNVPLLDGSTLSLVPAQNVNFNIGGLGNFYNAYAKGPISVMVGIMWVAGLVKSIKVDFFGLESEAEAYRPGYDSTVGGVIVSIEDLSRGF